MRHYRIYVWSHGHRTVTPVPTYVRSSHAKVGETAIIWFRRIFGRNPDRLFWQAKGFMAGAKDRRGNEVLVHQYNYDMEPGFDRRTGRFPLVIV